MEYLLSKDAAKSVKIAMMISDMSFFGGGSLILDTRKDKGTYAVSYGPSSYIEIKISDFCEADERIFIDGKMLASLLSIGDVTISIIDNSYIVATTSGGEYHIPLYPLPEYEVKTDLEVSELEFDSIFIKDLITFSKFTTSDELRPVMNHVAITGGYLAASDAHFMIYQEGEGDSEKEYLFSKEFIKVASLLGGNEIVYGNNHLGIRGDDFYYYTPRLTSSYPNITRVITSWDKRITYDVEELLGNINELKVVDHDVVIFDGDEMKCINEDFGKSGIEKLKEEVDIRIGFSLKKLSLIINTFAQYGVEKVTMEYDSPTKAVIFTGNPAKFAILLMPIMIQ